MLPRETGSPQEALAWIARGDPFDLAILDMHMPETGRGGTGGEDPGRCPGARSRCCWPRRWACPRRAEARELFAGDPAEADPSVSAVRCAHDDPGGAEQTAASGRARDAERSDPGMAGRHPLRILLAEDNAVNQKLALRLLSQMGYRADVAGNGLEAIQAVERQPYDVILMDVQMPEMDGLEATRQICARSLDGGRSVPRIIAMTANAMQGDREMCLDAGMDDYLSKPIRVEELVAALGQCRPLAR